MACVKLSKTPLEPEIESKIISSGQNGAIVSFIGSVRNRSMGRRVVSLEIDAYEQMAKDELERICAEASDLFEIRDIVILHRIGRMEPGDIIVMITVGAPHRSEAYKASRFLIEELKSRVPFWKKEIFEDGESWVTGGIPQNEKME